MSHKFKQILFITSGFFISSYFLYLSFNSLEFDKIYTIIKGFNLFWLFPALIVFFIGYLVRASRWMILCKTINIKITYIQSLKNILQGACVNNIFPLRLGDAFRVFQIRKIDKFVALKSILGIFILEKIFDILILLIGLLAVFYIDNNYHELIMDFITKTSLINHQFLLIILFVFSSILIFLFYKKINKVLSNFSIMVKIIGDKFFFLSKKLILLIILSFVAWLFEFLTFAFLAIGFEIPNFFGALASMVFGTLAAMIPSLPGFLGTFDYFAIQGMYLSGVDLPKVIAFVFLVRIVIWLPITLSGILLFMFVYKRELTSLFEREKLNE